MDGEAVDAAAIRVVDLQKKYHRSAFELADKLELTRPRARALRLHLGIDADPDCSHTFTFQSQKHVRYSDNAFTRMRDALNVGIDMDAIWTSHGASRTRGPRPVCTVVDCNAAPAVAS